jgi:orotidine-5'-phosphate decarboxylase
MNPHPDNPLVVAIDVSDLEAADRLAASLAGVAGMLKIGLEFFWACGPQAVAQLSRHGELFVDSKLHDIPNTVERASANIARLGVAMFNVHALGGDSMMRAAVEGARRGASETGQRSPKVIAVTRLSSMQEDARSSSTSLALQAKESGMDGVVVSGPDVADVRAACGPDFCLVVPGVRLSGALQDDQVRVLTPREALDLGADYLVIGRPITGAADPAAEATSVLQSIR